jgi:hypothetical protein
MLVLHLTERRWCRLLAVVSVHALALPPPLVSGSGLLLV